jgi:hypothetical protein
MLPDPFDYRGNVLGTVESIERDLGYRAGVDLIGMGARSETPYLFGSHMNLRIPGAVLSRNVPVSNTTGSKRFRPSFFDPDLPICSECPRVDPTDPCTYKLFEQRKPCNYGFARNANNFASPHDGNRFAQYRWG